ncbi:MAG: hypothetical protein K6A39_05355 [Clostridiales bacterium]|nr:hypothetical protein [Clostridiales bacterium]
MAVLSLLLLIAGCGAKDKQAQDQSRDLPFEDITKEAHSWRAETCRLIVSGESAEISGRVRNKGAWPISGLTMYVKFLDENGEVLTTGSCETVLDSPAKENDTAGYTIQIRNFYNYDSIVSVTVEFGK